MPNTTTAPAGDATFIVPMIRLRDGSVGCTQMAGSSGSLVSAAVPYAASTCIAFDSGDGAGGGSVESSSGHRPAATAAERDRQEATQISAPAAPASGSCVQKFILNIICIWRAVPVP